MPCCNCKLNITILVLSSTALFIQVLLLALKDFQQSVVLQVVIAVLNASLAFIQSLQIGLKKEANSSEADVEATEPVVIKIESSRRTEECLQPVSDTQE